MQSKCYWHAFIPAKNCNLSFTAAKFGLWRSIAEHILCMLNKTVLISSAINERPWTGHMASASNMEHSNTFRSMHRPSIRNTSSQLWGKMTHPCLPCIPSWAQYPAVQQAPATKWYIKYRHGLESNRGSPVKVPVLRFCITQVHSRALHIPQMLPVEKGQLLRPCT